MPTAHPDISIVYRSTQAILQAEKIDAQALKTRLQGWYNADKGRSIQKELLQLLSHLCSDKG